MQTLNPTRAPRSETAFPDCAADAFVPDAFAPVVEVPDIPSPLAIAPPMPLDAEVVEEDEVVDDEGDVLLDTPLRVLVWPLTTTTLPPGPREYVVPEMTIDPPGVSVCPPTTKAPVGPAVMVEGPIVISRGPCEPEADPDPAVAVTWTLEPPMTMPEPELGFKTVTPLTTVLAPGANVTPPTTTVPL
jgi:hypothetical protein